MKIEHIYFSSHTLYVIFQSPFYSFYQGYNFSIQ